MEKNESSEFFKILIYCFRMFTSVNAPSFDHCSRNSCLLLHLVSEQVRQVRNFTEIFEMQRLHSTGFREIYVFPTRKDRSFNFQERITTLSTLISTQVIWFSYLCSCPFFNSVPGFLVKLFIGRYQKSLFLIKSTIEVN